MNAMSDYFHGEREHLLRTADMIEQLLGKPSLSDYEVIAMGKLLQDTYTGIERILRGRLEAANVKIKKTENWHKELLLAARDKTLISEEQFEGFKKLLLFRHMQTHGYGYRLEKERLLELAAPIPATCRKFLTDIP
jgi:hypothetical protein